MAYPKAQGNGKSTQGAATDKVPDMQLKMLKGVHLPLNERTHGFISDALRDIGQVYSDERHEIEPGDVLHDLVTGNFDEPSGLEWHAASDKFGEKAIVAIPFAITGQQEQKGELRVIAILKKDKTLSIDVRLWGNY